MDIKQDGETVVYYCYHTGKGHTCHAGHVVKFPEDVCFQTTDKAEWESHSHDVEPVVDSGDEHQPLEPPADAG